VSAVIDAPAELIFTFLSRPDNHVALDASGMLRASTHHALTQVGAVFVMNMYNQTKGDHQVENHLVCYERGRAVDWAPAERGEEPAGHTWTWRLKPIGPEQTLVTEIYDWSAFRHTDMLDHLPVISRSPMQESLARLAKAIEHCNKDSPPSS
jgi:uncharacterized protein YndB with AHSA1/START domain